MGHKAYPDSVQSGKPKLPSPKPSWYRSTFGQVLEEVKRPANMQDEKTYQLVTVKRSRGGIVEREKRTGKKILVKSQFFIRTGDFLISKRQIVHGACVIVPEEFDGAIVSNEYSVLRPKEDLDLNFLGYFSHTIYFQQTCFHSSIGVHIEKMIFKLDDWFKWKINLPKLPEQQKIADFLGVVDEKINALTRKKDLLGHYKKGVMQQIFTQKIRFKDDAGNDFPDWEEKKIDSLLLNKKGAMKIGPFGSQLKKQTFVSSGFKVYGQENIFIENFCYGDRFITTNHFQSLSSNEIFPGDFVISTMGTIGESTIVPENIQRGIMDSHMIRFQLHRNVVAPQYLGQLFKSFLVQKQIKRLSVGGIMDGLSIGIVKEIKFHIPESTLEQQKIADFLTAIDDKITTTQNQITHMQTFKKGLLQQMFV